MTDDPKRTPPPIPANDPRRTTGRYAGVDKVTVPEQMSIPALLGEIQESVKSGFERVNANIDTLNHSFDGLQDRVARLEERDAKSRTGPQRSYSGPIQALTAKTDNVSQNDMKQDATIGVLVSDLASAKADIADLKVSQAKQTGMLTDQTKMLTEVWEGGKAFIDSPTGRIIKGLLYLSLAGYAATRGIHVGP